MSRPENKAVKNNIDPYKEEKEGTVREVGNLAVWSLSSCKPGFGVEQLLDSSLETYWQSDGPQPHFVNIQFHKKITLSDICVYADVKTDESYTPQKLSIRIGNHVNDLIEIDQVELTEPNGWVSIPLRNEDHKHIRTFMLQIMVMSNHQNGRDTHMRNIKIHSPIKETKSSSEYVWTSKWMKTWDKVR